MILDFQRNLLIGSDVGLVGEIFAGFLLLLARRVSSEFFCSPVPLGSFLMHLLGSGAISSISADWLNAAVAFNAVFRCYIDITQEVLVDAWRRRVILLCKQNTVGIDLVIPVCKAAKASDNNNQDVVVDQSTISGLVIQIKNWASSMGNPQDICVNMKTIIDAMVWAPIGIIMAVGKKGRASTCKAVTVIDECHFFAVDMDDIKANLAMSDEFFQKLLHIRDPIEPVMASCQSSLVTFSKQDQMNYSHRMVPYFNVFETKK